MFFFHCAGDPGMALGIVGVVVKGLLYLLFTGIGVLLVAFLLGALVDAAAKRAEASYPVIPSGHP